MNDSRFGQGGAPNTIAPSGIPGHSGAGISFYPPSGPVAGRETPSPTDLPSREEFDAIAAKLDRVTEAILITRIFLGAAQGVEIGADDIDDWLAQLKKHVGGEKESELTALRREIERRPQKPGGGA